MAEVIEDHIREHVAGADLAVDERARGADQLVEVVRSYLK
jgi:DNA-binding FrmR family transcriptional regulator